MLLSLVLEGAYPGVETSVTPDEPGDSTLVLWWKGLGEMVWRRVVRCAGLWVGFLGSGM
jgi:hypothetical protein